MQLISVLPPLPREELWSAGECPVPLWSVPPTLCPCTWTLSAARCARVSTAHTPGCFAFLSCHQAPFGMVFRAPGSSGNVSHGGKRDLGRKQIIAEKWTSIANSWGTFLPIVSVKFFTLLGIGKAALAPVGISSWCVEEHQACGLNFLLWWVTNQAVIFLPVFYFKLKGCSLK